MRIAELVHAVEAEGQAVFVIVADTHGSVPRETGAGMVVTPTQILGTIGGGTVENRAIEKARGLMGAGSSGNVVLDFPLGPALDQCCGGNMQVGFAVFGAVDLERLSAAGGVLELWKGGPVFRDPAEVRAVLIYGAGHVGTALAQALAPLPFRVHWIDSRLDAFPQQVPLGVETVTTPLPEAQAKAAPPDALHVVLTHSHALDMEIVSAVMERGDFGHLGLIGSATKRALFLRRLRERGICEMRLARLVCPIGLPGLNDKRPAVIAASVAAGLLQITQDIRESA